MRSLLAGLILFLAPAFAFAQAAGFVESIGFENTYRPDCWTSMVVNLTPETDKVQNFQIQVRQEDLDRDRPIFTRTITLTGASEGAGARQQKFSMYFIPQPTDGGLPDARDAGSSLKELQDRLKVSLCSASGKWIADLPMTATVMNADPRQGSWESRRGSKLVLTVSNGSSRPAYRDNTASTGLLGMIEDVVMIAVQPRDLPENVLGYDAIDAIVWLNADPAELRGAGGERFRALEAYVRRGGSLVICQCAQWQRTLEFGELLPVTIEAMRDKQDISPLRELAEQRDRAPDELNPWDRVKGPFRVARAQAKPGALIDQWIVWDKAGKDYSPYIVRQPFGLGAVTWVAQDLGDPFITLQVKQGWPNVWDRVFDWKNDPIPMSVKSEERVAAPYLQGVGIDIGASLISGMDLESKTAWLVTLAIVFFIAYWLVAGPGVFAYLVGRRKTQLSWFMFGASAVAATLITVLLVQLVLRGPPELKHFTVVKKAPNQPAIMHSRFGLYIPRDGYQKVELKETALNNVSTISAFAMNPSHLKSTPDMQGPEYPVPVVEATTTDPPAVSIPFSSTLKKLQASWVGELGGAIEGSAWLIETGWIEGNLTNGTGLKLRNVYIAFKYPTAPGQSEDWILYLPTWDPGVTIDLKREFNRQEDGSRTPLIGPSPDFSRKLRGRIFNGWDSYWFKPMRGANMLGDGTRDDSNDRVRSSLVMMSLYNRLPPVKNEGGTNRFELLRRSGRHLDVSGALAAGALVILAEEDGPAKLPFPLEVEGDRIEGRGLTFYQFVLPLDRSKHPAATQPAWNTEGE